MLRQSHERLKFPTGLRFALDIMSMTSSIVSELCVLSFFGNFLSKFTSLFDGGCFLPFKS